MPLLSLAALASELHAKWDRFRVRIPVATAPFLGAARLSPADEGVHRIPGVVEVVAIDRPHCCYRVAELLACVLPPQNFKLVKLQPRSRIFEISSLKSYNLLRSEESARRMGRNS